MFTFGEVLMAIFATELTDGSLMAITDSFRL